MGMDLYEHDIATWSEQQSALLRLLASGERVNGIDWENVAEEIESVGRSEVKSVESLLNMALIHAFKLAHWPGHPAADGWAGEVVNFLAQARDRFEPAMARRIEAAALLERARRAVAKLEMTGHAKLPLEPGRAASLDELLGEDTGVGELVALVSGQAGGHPG